MFIYPLRFVKTHKDICKDRSQRKSHGLSVDLIKNFTVQNKIEKNLSSFLVMFRLRLWLRMRFIAGISVKRLVISKETKHFLETFPFLIWETKEKVSLQE